MLKTLGIGCLVLVVLIVGGLWFGYRKMVAGGDTVTVTIAAPASRVFASLANHDSLPTWMVSMRGRQSERHGTFAEGDTTAVTDSSASGRQRRQSRWVVTSVTPDRQVILELHTDSSGLVVATRRDSLVSRGDSTTVIATLSSGIADAARSRGGDARGAQTVLDASSKVIVAGMRMVAEADLKNLKNHIEGRPVVAPR